MPRTAPESWRCCDASAAPALNMTSKLQVELPIRASRPRRLTPLPCQECYVSHHIPSNIVGATLVVALTSDGHIPSNIVGATLVVALDQTGTHRGWPREMPAKQGGIA